jgi:hypothetical protein
MPMMTLVAMMPMPPISIVIRPVIGACPDG